MLASRAIFFPSPIRLAAAVGSILVALAAACAPAGPLGDREGTEIAQAHRSRCGACHLRVEPGMRTRAELEAALGRHRKRVHLTDKQWAEMVDYLAASPQAMKIP